ncbi:MAG: O-fucosyltransferase family protein [Planctomycetota bacterium]|jgi:hypothetical protein
MTDEPQPYLIYRQSGPYGFFSDFLFVLDVLDEIDRQDFRPVIDMQRFPTRYSEVEPVNGTMNSWEYYFTQPAQITVDQALALNATDCESPRSGYFSTYDFRRFERKWRRGRELITLYVHLRNEILEQIDTVWSGRERVIGVHYRGSDMKSGAAYGHPLPQGLDQFVDATEAALRKQGADSVFLATDDDEAVSRFRQRFGDRVWMTDACRTDGSYDGTELQPWLTSSQRTQHRYLSGREVLTDALLLARCDHLVHGWSNVAKAAVLFSRQLPGRTELAPIGFAGKRRGSSIARRLRRFAQRLQSK